MNSEIAGEMFSAQKRLRRQILDSASSVSYQPAKDLAAHLLLSLDDVNEVWRMATAWLCQELGVERVDGGYANADDRVYLPGQNETVCEPGGIPSYRGLTVNNRDFGVLSIWRAPGPLVFAEVLQDRRFGADLRLKLAHTGARSKIAMSLRAGKRPFGLLCADRVNQAQTQWTRRQFDIFETVGQEVLGPILDALREFSPGLGRARPDAEFTAILTPAESRVAQLIALGLSYKEIAHRVDRSVHTVDHQLRAIRRKLNISSHAKLVQFFSKPA